MSKSTPYNYRCPNLVSGRIRQRLIGGANVVGLALQALQWRADAYAAIERIEDVLVVGPDLALLKLLGTARVTGGFRPGNMIGSKNS